ncbi:MAG: glycosyltransferase family 2 protein, partial [Planctomycetota bacterium]|nr:glycosyltransferase family 2 protein [Planctomycetota bacterium]
MPHISFIIPAYNEEVYVGRTIDSIHEAARALPGASGLDYEVIVVDDASDDKTGQVAQDHGAIVHRVELRHIAAVRNAGALIAKGAIFVFVDADTILPSQTLAGALKSLEDERVVGGGSG